MYLIFDTETTGLPKRWKAPVTDTDNWPRCVQIAWQLHDDQGVCLQHCDFIIRPDGFNIPYDAEKIHGISTALAATQGVPLISVLEKFNEALDKAKFVVGQNVGFDLNIMGCEYHRMQVVTPLNSLPVLDTCTETTASLCQLPGGRGGKFKLPTLTELHQYLFKTPFAEAHNATADVEATTRCFLELLRRGTYSTEQLQANTDYLQEFQKQNPYTIAPLGLKHINLKKAATALAAVAKKTDTAENISEIADVPAVLLDAPVVHLHNHSQFSILQSTISIKKLVKATADAGMTSVALTDHGNMMGAFHFVKEIRLHNKSLVQRQKDAEASGEVFDQKPIKPIIGCEFFVCDDHSNKSQKDNGYQIVFLAKNKRGYQNLVKMSSLAFTDGFYYLPRIDRNIVETYKQDLIVLSGNLYGEVPSKVLNVGEKQAEEALLWWKAQFGEDFYIELMRHGQEDEDRVNPVLIQFSQKHNIPLVATNNTYYIDQTEANAHDILLCVKDGEKQATPVGRGRGYRYGLPNQEYYFKSPEEMKELFKDLPETILNMQAISDKIEAFELARDVLLPKFDIPKEFINSDDAKSGTKHGENAYLRHLTYEGAKKRYKTISEDLKERIDFELKTIEKTGYPGYFLIVEDFIREARSLGVSVGPGRGSAAGSVVAYCLWITNIDPIKYNLLFERFLNPDRISMPDIDIDFDDEGRVKVMDYVINKYGSNQVAQIITYGKMAAKSSIRDTARVLDLPLGDADRIAKLVPNMSKLNKIFGVEEKILRQKFRAEDMELINQLLNISEGDDLE
ncbi:MAG: DNA polymerase III subunit alpha, partial [Flavobacteriaceae bacterium]|nr:DNA polymerase III subunit alpha [Flavobacteriaceae bacterium]